MEHEAWRREIEVILNEVRPALLEHGGDAVLLGIEDGRVKIALKGACHGCPMSVMTFGIMVDEMIKRRIPEVKEVAYE